MLLLLPASSNFALVQASRLFPGPDETLPDKITFGTDCFPYNEVLGSEKSYWFGVQSSREALAAAHAYLHDTAVKLYAGRVH